MNMSTARFASDYITGVGTTARISNYTRVLPATKHGKLHRRRSFLASGGIRPKFQRFSAIPTISAAAPEDSVDAFVSLLETIGVPEPSVLGTASAVTTAVATTAAPAAAQQQISQLSGVPPSLPFMDTVDAPAVIASATAFLESVTQAAGGVLPTEVVQQLSELIALEQQAQFGYYTGYSLGDLGVLVGTILYGLATPGIFGGAVDAYILGPIDAILQPRVSSDKVKTQVRLGNGAFGAVYLADLNGKEVVVKKGKSVEGGEDFQTVEAYMNRRMRRSVWTRFITAPFIASYKERAGNEESTVLMWQYKGDRTLEELMNRRDFPLCLEEDFYGKEQKGDETKRSRRIIRRIAKQVFGILKELHATGIVHRDVKPANLVLMDGRFRLIDFGAAADLRVGYNYEPDVRLLDPSYCPPELYVMPENTPPPPPAPIAALFSPLLWQFNRPDLFDTYSAGLILLQLCAPQLRNKQAMSETGAFQRNLGLCDYDLGKWKEDYTGGNWDLELLDPLAMDLCSRLITQRNGLRRGRLSAAAALAHPYLVLP